MLTSDYLKTKFMKKKSHELNRVPIPNYVKWLLMVKFILIFTLAFAAHSMASESKAQNKVSMQFKDVKLKNLLNSIEEQTAVSFIYNDNAIRDIRIADIRVEKKDWRELLRPILKAQNFQMTLVGTNRVLIEKNNEQSNIASGTVKDQHGNPLVAVSVKQKGTERSTSTNSDGQFSLETEGNNPVLIFSYVSFLSQEIPFTGQPMQVTLAEDLAQLEEVVVVGYGTQKRVN